MESLDVAIEDGVGTIFLDRPQCLNALGKSFWKELPEAVKTLELTREVRVIVLRARGPHFSSGLDLSEIDLNEPAGDDSPAERNMRLYRHVKQLQSAITTLASCSKATIAAIHGYCLGGGVDLIAACDIRLCSLDAVFSIRETKIAIVADVGSLQRLPHIIPKGVLYELALTGRDFFSSEALNWGLVTHVEDTVEALVSKTSQVAQEIAHNSPLAVEGTKEILSGIYRSREAEQLDRVALWNAAFLRSNDLREALSAYRQKRSPTFQGD